MYEYNSRDEVPKQYKWDLTKRYKNDEEWLKNYDEVKKEISKINDFKGKLLCSAKSLYECLCFNDQMDIKLNRLYVYAYLKKDEDVANSIYTKMFQKIYNLFCEFISLSSYVEPELLKGEYLTVEKFMQEYPLLKKYERNLKDIYRLKSHVLNENSEKIITELTRTTNVYEDIAVNLLDNDIKYGYIKRDNKMCELTNSNYASFMVLPDRKLRKKAYLMQSTKMQEFQNTFALNLLSYLKTIDIDSKLHNYESYFDSKQTLDKIPKEVYFSLLKYLNANFQYYHRYFSIRKRILGYKKMYAFDSAIPLLKDYDKKYTIEEAQELVLNAVSVLGKEYQDSFKKIFAESWIDYCSYKGKNSAQYQIDNYGDTSNISMHFQGLLTDVSTIAHEGGHAIHSYLTSKYNEVNDTHITTLNAEVASLTNEILLANYMLKNSKDLKEKIDVITRLIEVITDNFYGAGMYAEFEYDINNKIFKQENLSYVELNNRWLELLKKYYGPSVNVLDESCASWARITHFFSPFYTYKYALSVTCACFVATNILKNDETFKDKYLQYLKSGSKKDSLELLEDLGIDLKREETYKYTTNMINELLDELEKLLKEVNNG